MKINLGSGELPIPEYINVDVRDDLPGVDIACNALDLVFEDESCDELFARDVLEHMPRRRWREALDEWIRVIKPGGVLKIRFPDTLMLFKAYENGSFPLERLFQLVFGDQDVPENAHLSGLTKQLVIDYLKQKGLIILKDWRDGYADIRITASKGTVNDSLNLDHPDYQFK